MDDDPKCPYCGHVQHDAWEFTERCTDGDEVTCGECGKDFWAEANISVSWRTKALDRKPTKEGE